MKNEGYASVRRLTSNHICLRFLCYALFFILHSSFFICASHAQLNTDRLITIGRSALYYEDYVVSIQYFNQAITAKPYLY